MRKHGVHLSSVLAIFSLAPAALQPLTAEQAAAPERLDLSSFPGEIVDRVVVPIPAEIFTVLDKLDEPDWNSGILLPENDVRGRNRTILALTFGSLVGEGFIAVQAKNTDAIQKVGRRVLTLSESLGLASAVRPHSLSIVEAAEARDWQKVRDELDRTQQTVKRTMEQLRDDEELSGLVSLGGWLRGTHVVTHFISLSYSEDKAELLNQPGLLKHFRELLDSLPTSGSSPQIRTLSTGLARLEAIIDNGGNVSQEEVTEMRDICRSMLEEFYFSRE